MQPVGILQPPIRVDDGVPRSVQAPSFQAPVREMLHFPNQTLPLWTPFRGQVLNYIFKTALGSLGDQLKSAVVSVSSVPDEEDTYALNLTLTVAGGWPTIREVRDEILTKVSEWSTEWSGQQQQDYGRRIYFGLIPSEL